jgi:hypothetical protein
MWNLNKTRRVSIIKNPTILVGVAISLIIFAPCAVTSLSLARAAQYETNERSECETNERIHLSERISVRSSKCKGRPTQQLLPNGRSPKENCVLQQAVAHNVAATPEIVDWSPSMRC